MKIKFLLPVFIFALLLGGCGNKTATTTTPKTNVTATKLLVNALALKDRPFSVLVPHSSGKIFTFFVQNANKASSASIDLEYQSGDLLKGARASLQTPIANPYTKAVVLGSCSTGGKCTFDTELKSGTMKFKLNFPGDDATNILKGDFTFISGQKNLPDGKFVLDVTKTKTTPEYIMSNSFGLPKDFGKDIILYPVVIASTSDKNLVGTLTINQSDIASVSVYDGSTYQPLKFTSKDGSVMVKLDQKPWSVPATIIRDDLKSSQESTNLYIIGPIILSK